MRVFWLIVGILVVVSAVVLFVGPGSGDDTPLVLEERSSVPESRPGPERSGVATAPANDRTSSADATGRMIEEPWVRKRSGSANHAGHDPEAAARRLKALSRPGGFASLDALLGIEEEPEEDDSRPGPRANEEAADKLLQILAIASLVGEGTAENPYVVSWELLDTARQTYRPSDAMTTIPPDVEKLDGAIVRLEGYFLAPFSLSSTDQLLLMRYVWDGCCIGVPPTAYSTVEVGLAEPVGRTTLAEARTLTVEGRFKIDPYESRGWLLSLYLLEDARVVRSE